MQRIKRYLGIERRRNARIVRPIVPVHPWVPCILCEYWFLTHRQYRDHSLSPHRWSFDDGKQSWVIPNVMLFAFSISINLLPRDSHACFRMTTLKCLNTKISFPPYRVPFSSQDSIMNCLLKSMITLTMCDMTAASRDVGHHDFVSLRSHAVRRWIARYHWGVTTRKIRAFILIIRCQHRFKERFCRIGGRFERLASKRFQYR